MASTNPGPTPSAAESSAGAERSNRPGGPGRLAGRTISRVGFGALQLPRLASDRAAAVALLRRMVELGVDHVDTAQFYGDGLANRLLREALRPEDGVLIATKVGGDPNPGGSFPVRLAQRPEQLRASVEDNLTALGLDQLPLVNLRRFDRIDAGPTMHIEGDQIVALDDQLAEMTALRDEGKIGAIGLSTVTLEVLRRALPVGIACVQNAYSLADRGDEDLLELCLAEGIAWVPYFPLGGALSGLPKVVDRPDVQAAAEQLGATPHQIGLAWLLHHAPNILLIPGTADAAHLESNAAVGALAQHSVVLAALN